jgi:hypothetical protein
VSQGGIASSQRAWDRWAMERISHFPRGVEGLFPPTQEDGGLPLQLLGQQIEEGNYEDEGDFPNWDEPLTSLQEILAEASSPRLPEDDAHLEEAILAAAEGEGRRTRLISEREFEAAWERVSQETGCTEPEEEGLLGQPGMAGEALTHSDAQRSLGITAETDEIENVGNGGRLAPEPSGREMRNRAQAGRRWSNWYFALKQMTLFCLLLLGSGAVVVVVFGAALRAYNEEVWGEGR